MQVIEFLKRNQNLTSIEDGLSKLTNELGIKVKRYDNLGSRDPIIVLDYSQIDSPKTHPIVIECRGLTLNAKTLEVVARGYDRFFNLGEALNVMPEIDWRSALLYEKVDGSFIKIYYYQGRWEIATRGTAFAESDCMGHGITFRELVYKALSVRDDNEFQDIMTNSLMFQHYTYLFELTSVENRVVKHYHGYNLHFLGARNNETGEMEKDEANWIKNGNVPLSNVVQFPKVYKFETEDDCVKAVRELKDLDEGYVLYQNGVPVAKVKSPAYVAVHHIRGEGLNPKRMSELVLSGEVEEYLTYFPEDRPVIQPYIDGLETLTLNMEQVYRNTWFINDQKEFAQSIAGLPFKGVLFAARKDNGDVIASFNKQRMSFRIELLRKYVK